MIAFIRPLSSLRGAAIAALLTFASLGASSAGKAATATDFASATLPKSGAEPNDLPYRYLVPGGYNSTTEYPLIVFLHGAGERGNNNTAQLNNSANGALTLVSTANQAAYPCFMLAPQASVAEGWNGNTLAQVIRTIQELSLNYSIDPNRIYITGLSMGGGGTWDIIKRYPTFFAAAVPMSGWGAGSYEKIVGLPIWNFHAANDGTVAVGGSDNAVAATRQLGGRVIYTRYATGGHSIWPTAYANPHLLPWMMTQRRNQPMAGVPLISIETPGRHLALPPATATRNVAGAASLPGGVTKINWTFAPWLGGAGVDTSTYAVASGTDNWSVPNAPVAADSKLFLAIATGSSWATGTGSATGGGVTTLNDYFWNVPTGANVTAPTIAIASPTSSGSLTTTAFSLAIAGTASPASGKTVQAVTWKNDRGGEGTCLGTTTWNIDNIDLQSGDNLLTVTVRDSHSITASTTLAVFVSTGSVTTYRHGDTVTLTGAFGTQNVTKTFLGGANGMIESQAVGANMPNSNNWTFDSLGYTAKIKTDATRGKVLFNPEDETHYNATRRFDSGAPIPEQRYFYKAHYVRNVMLLDGLPYTKTYQWKHERINWENSVVDGNCEIKMHDWNTQSPITFVNRSATDKSTYYGGYSADHNGGWALMETIVFTGTQGQPNGKMITRVHKNGHTYISQNLQTERIYADPTLRLRYFVEQNYFGNFGQVEDGVDNTKPKPQVKELYSDDSQVIVGLDATSGSKRVELRDTIALNTATIREVQDWTTWNGNITLRLNTGGLAVGTHDLYLVVIAGIDVNGWDIVSSAQPIRVQVEAAPDASTAPVLTTQPVSQRVVNGNPVTFVAAATGIPSPTFQWKKDGINLVGATSAGYTIAMASPGDAGSYTVVATNSVGAVTSNPATLTVRPFVGSTIDFNNDSRSDLLWQNVTTGARRAWFMNGTVKGSEATLSALSTDWQIAGTADFNADGKPDLLWQNTTTGERQVGLMSGTNATSFVSLGVVDLNWNIGATADLNGDANPDIIWENTLTGERGIWLMLGTARIGWASLGTLPIQWNLAGTGDFNDDNKPDLVWQNTLTGERKVWLMNDTVKASEVSLGFVALEWAIGSIADYTGDGQPDIFWQNSTTGERLIWVMNGTTLDSYAFLPTETLDWVVGRIPRRPAAADFNRDGKPDLIWQSATTGDRKVWLMNATTFSSEVSLGLVGTAWQIAGTGDLSGDGLCDVLWQNTTTGERAVWVMSGTNISAFVSLGTVPTDWQMTGAGDFNADNQTDIVWQNTVTGERGIWLMAGTALSGYASLGVVAPVWQIAAVADLNRNDNPDLIWQNTATGERKVWLMTGTAFGSEVALGTVGLEWQIVGAADYDLNGSVDIVWQNTLTGERGIWLMNATVLSGYVSLGIQSTTWQIGN